MATTTEITQSFREKFDELERSIAAQPQADAPIVHHFAPGLYVREMHLKAGYLLTTVEHLSEHVFVLSDGIVMVTSEAEGSVTYEAPFTGVTKPGTRRAMYAVTDAVWSTFHPNPTDERDVEKIMTPIISVNDNLPSDYDIGWKRSLPRQLSESCQPS